MTYVGILLGKCLGIGHSQDDKSLNCTRAVKGAFGSANVKRVRRSGEEMYPFC